MTIEATIGASLYGGPILSDIEFRRKRYGEKGVFTSRHLPRLVKGGINLIILPAQSMQEIEALFLEIKEGRGAIALVKSAQEAREAIGRGQCACVLGASHDVIGGDIDQLDLLYTLGVRLFTMSGNRRNVFTDGCGERDAAGLSYLGIDLVQRLEELGILIDVSHISERGFWNIFEMTKRATIVASHSNSRRVCDNRRNLSDEQIKAIADRGGMVGTSMHPTMVAAKDPEVNDVVNHMEYVMQVASPDNVGLGTDFVDYAEEFFRHRIRAMDPTGSIYGGALHPYPKGVENIEKVGNIFVLLEKGGYDVKILQKLKGENVLRVLRMVTH